MRKSAKIILCVKRYLWLCDITKLLATILIIDYKYKVTTKRQLTNYVYHYGKRWSIDCELFYEDIRYLVNNWYIDKLIIPNRVSEEDYTYYNITDKWVLYANKLPDYTIIDWGKEVYLMDILQMISQYTNFQLYWNIFNKIPDDNIKFWDKIDLLLIRSDGIPFIFSGGDVQSKYKKCHVIILQLQWK